MTIHTTEAQNTANIKFITELQTLEEVKKVEKNLPKKKNIDNNYFYNATLRQIDTNDEGIYCRVSFNAIKLL